MQNFLLAHESEIRLSFFATFFVGVALWEWLQPRRKLLVSKSLRWTHNVLLTVLNTVLLRLLFPLAAVGVAAFIAEQQWGLFNYWSLPTILTVLCSVILLDMLIYLQHVLFHAVPLLWKLHQVHHADLDYDLTTGARFHPIEIVLSMLIKCTFIIALGIPVVAVIIFEILLSSMALFNHGNIKLPTKLDAILRYFIVTPDMHRVHHSIYRDECDSNFGFNLTLWDRLFGTYKDQARDGQTTMTIGIKQFQSTSDCVLLWGLLSLPFKKTPKVD